MGSTDEEVLCVYHNFAFVVVYGASGPIPQQNYNKSKKLLVEVSYCRGHGQTIFQQERTCGQQGGVLCTDRSARSTSLAVQRMLFS